MEAGRTSALSLKLKRESYERATASPASPTQGLDPLSRAELCPWHSPGTRLSINLVRRLQGLWDPEELGDGGAGVAQSRHPLAPGAGWAPIQAWPHGLLTALWVPSAIRGHFLPVETSSVTLLASHS